ncbi:MAG: hypothetical protein P8020_06625 [Acidobacteriota bacterium]
MMAFISRTVRTAARGFRVPFLCFSIAAVLPALSNDWIWAQAAQALATARRDVVERGLTTTVAQNYFAAVIAKRQNANAREALQQAQRFLTI